ncbi:hemicentin-1-like [Synchiropus splendidus]|uniref:hemicentin-1-like n=1 Tax=Synchiropus splendidus TaxID=270530 RepID=UPI00237E81A5|nr:hemicentin-1-like [Synchiropus splendidus]
MFPLFIVLVCFSAVCRCQQLPSGELELVLLPTWQDFFSNEILQFHCRVNASNWTLSADWTFRWYRDGNELLGSDPMVTLTEQSKMSVKAARYYSGNYSCTVSDGSDRGVQKSNLLQIRVHDVPTPTATLVTHWQHVFPEERVDMSCSVDSGVGWTFSWFQDQRPLRADGSLSFNSDRSTLSIGSASVSHAGTYQCQAQLPGRTVETSTSGNIAIAVHKSLPTVSMTKQPDHRQMFSGELLTLSCHVNIPSRWTYLWFHDNRRLDQNSSSLHIPGLKPGDTGPYSCGVQRGGGQVFLAEPHSRLQLTVDDVPTPTATLVTHWQHVFPEERVDMSCSVDSGVGWTFSWFRDQRPLRADGSLSFNSDRSTLSIGSALVSHAGTYQCQAQLPGRTVETSTSGTIVLAVHKSLPTVSMTKQPDHRQMFSGELLTLSCHVNIPSRWTYLWFHDNRRLDQNSSSLHIPALKPGDTGPYSCGVQRGGGQVFLAEPHSRLQLTVDDVPTPTATLVTHWQDVFPEERVDMSCSVDSGVGWTFSWFQDQRPLRADGSLSFNSDRSTLSIGSASVSHAGTYQCQAQLPGRTVETSTSGTIVLMLHKSLPTVSMTKQPDHRQMFSGELLTLSCHVNIPSRWTYLWFHANRRLDQNSSSLHIPGLKPGDTGPYSCGVQRGGGQVFLAEPHSRLQLTVDDVPTPTATLVTRWQDVFPEERVDMSCSVDSGVGWTFSWFRDQRPLRADGSLSFNSDRSTLSIGSASVSHAGTYQCQAQLPGRTVETSTSGTIVLMLHKSLPTVSMTKQPDHRQMFSGELLTLSCHVNIPSRWTYLWFHANRRLDQNSSSLHIPGLKPGDTGPYSCGVQRGGGQVFLAEPHSRLQLTVDDVPTPTATLVTRWQDVFPEERVDMSCSVDSGVGWTFSWFRDQRPLRADGSLSFNSDRSTLSIGSASVSHAGTYQCQAQLPGRTVETSTNGNITIAVHKLPRAVITLSTKWSEVFSTDSLELRCEVQEDQKDWNYTWYRGAEEIQQHSSQHTVTPQNDPDQGEYKCKGQRSNQRPSQSLKSEPFKTKNLLLKRRVLLSISGCLMFSLVTVLLGFIIYRVVRKPVRREATVEEVDLFLTMDQLKERVGSAPCQLVDYITDMDVPVKEAEAEQNGSSSPDAMLSPLEQSAESEATESPDHPENGLLTFRQ